MKCQRGTSNCQFWGTENEHAHTELRQHTVDASIIMSAFSNIHDGVSDVRLAFLP